eukprot:TRINITY_DN815_c1_g2_i1.p2 TRINITY_DN815_c1_g2~~TRINITY_DN815_c1_g2_i1.p2  ORF type:complete len:177 (-),score=5.44 TRINITY_DN815_c1_g2_i1:559-1089(-)
MQWLPWVWDSLAQLEHGKLSSKADPWLLYVSVSMFCPYVTALMWAQYLRQIPATCADLCGSISLDAQRICAQSLMCSVTCSAWCGPVLVKSDLLLLLLLSKCSSYSGWQDTAAVWVLLAPCHDDWRKVATILFIALAYIMTLCLSCALQLVCTTPPSRRCASSSRYCSACCSLDTP